jgi:aspartate/methionine/tyrosine aminotransferase
MCEYLLENAGVVGMPGSAYGEETACCMRFSFANATEDLERAARKITDALLKLQQK